MSRKGVTSISLRDIISWTLYLSLAAALQQQPYDHAFAAKSANRLSVNERHHDQSDSLRTPLSGQRGFRDTHVDRQRTSPHHDERALATLSPAESLPAAQVPPASSPSSTNGLTSRHPARSLQDWRVEDIVLLATVDGKIYARDRSTGASKWVLEVDRPMVETIYHRHNRSVDEDGSVQEDPLWIVEPSQDGSIYVYAPGTGLGLQRLGYTVKQLADLAPYASDGDPAVVYTAEKKTELYTIDAASGHISYKFSSTGSTPGPHCRRASPLDALDDDECEAIGTLTLGHTEYIIGIQDRNTGEQISTIHYFEWAPNNRDLDLRSKYTRAMDGKYVSTKHDGDIYGLDFGTSGYLSSPGTPKKQYRHKLSAPVARVYDLVRPADDESSETALVVLPQPPVPFDSGYFEDEDSSYENIFVNCTESGSWYALSERTYPTVTEGAKLAKCYREGSFHVPSLPLPKSHQELFTGIHWLSSQNSPSSQAMIGNQEYLAIEAPPVETSVAEKAVEQPQTSKLSMITTYFIILSGLVAFIAIPSSHTSITSVLGRLSLVIPGKSDLLTSSKLDTTAELPSTPRIRQNEPAEETIFPHTDTPGLKLKEPVEQENPAPQIDDIVEPGADEAVLKDGKKVKAHKRGKRGGRKAREKEMEQAERAKTKLSDSLSQPPEVITVAASESSQITGALQINSLVIHTDRVIGQGSCGTSVFEGSFEGRDVAVKRMLSQYYELASQEVSFLQQSDDHPNVVRYFCQQRDDHFLYIAVELCQASLFDVWESEKARTEERQQQLQALKLSIQQDVPKALQQLAAGLYHLHNLRIIHRDIKPQNILVAYPKRGQSGGPRLVISDFGLGKNLPENVSTLIDPTGNAGTSGWKAPELISQPRETDSKHSQSTSYNGGSECANGSTSGVKRAADIFSLGCLFFWVLTDGNHPFEDENGWHQLRELNIKRDHKKMDVLERWSDAYEPMQLITTMLAHEPENRPTAMQVVNHPFFWSVEKRLAFLCDVSDHFEREPRGVLDDDYAGDSIQLCTLEDRAVEVIGTSHGSIDFLAKLDRHFVDTLGRQRKYSGNRLLDLLRALRNKKNHYEDMPEDVKRRVGPLAGGYLSYWCNRFPRLLMACYEVVHEAGIQNSDRFRGYFVVG